MRAEKELLLQFYRVKVNIPRKFLLKLFYSHKALSHTEYLKIGRKLRQIEDGINKLEHCKSIVEKIRGRNYGHEAGT